MDQLRPWLAAPRPVPGLGLISGGLLLVAAYAAVLAWAMDTQTYSVWGGLIVVPIVVAVNAVLIWRAINHHDEEPWLAWLLPVAYLAKLVGIVVRYVVAYVVYDGASDAERYNQYAAANYRLWRDGAFVWDPGGPQGTQFMEIVTTAVYAITGPTPFGGFVIFGSLAFWGVYLLYRAFRIALPGADRRRYATLLFLLPSLLYWPASIGKESWLLLFVGVTAWGGARFFAGATASGLAALALGVVATAAVRPHITVLLVAALLVAQLVKPTTKASISILTKLAGAAVLAGAVAILATQSAEFLGIDDLSLQGISETYDFRSGNTEQGGSAFEPVPLDSPIGVPVAIVTLLFRPFPWEAGNAQMLVQSLESVVLLVLAVAAWPRVRRLPGLLRRNPYLVFAAVYTLGFILAFAGLGNFGMLARQRVLMLPFFLVLLALPLPGAARRALTEPEVARAGQR